MELYSLAYVIQIAWLQQDEGKGTFSNNHSWEEGRQGWVLGKQMNILHGDMDFVTNYTSHWLREVERLKASVSSGYAFCPHFVT